MSKGKFETTLKKLEFYNLRETNLSIESSWPIHPGTFDCMFSFQAF